MPLGMACMTELVDQVGRSLFNGDWPDITRAVNEPMNAPATLLAGSMQLSDAWRQKEPRLDPSWSSMIESAISRAQQLLDAMQDVAIIIDKDGHSHPVPRNFWRSERATVAISRGRSRAPSGDEGWICVPATVMPSVLGPSPQTEQDVKEPAFSQGNAPIDDTEEVELALSLLDGGARSARDAARRVVALRISEGMSIRGASQDAWEERIRTKLRARKRAQN